MINHAPTVSDVSRSLIQIETALELMMGGQFNVGILFIESPYQG